jgi:hypothetical protein
LEKTSQLLTQWLEDFKSKFGHHELGRPTIDEVESALKLYEDKMTAGMETLR